MAKKLEIGDRVWCRYYNDMDKRYYGEEFSGTIIDIGVNNNYSPPRDFTVEIKTGWRKPTVRYSTLWRKEILRRIV